MREVFLLVWTVPWVVADPFSLAPLECSRMNIAYCCTSRMRLMCLAQCASVLCSPSFLTSLFSTDPGDGLLFSGKNDRHRLIPLTPEFTFNGARGEPPPGMPRPPLLIPSVISPSGARDGDVRLPPSPSPSLVPSLPPLPPPPPPLMPGLPPMPSPPSLPSPQQVLQQLQSTFNERLSMMGFSTMPTPTMFPTLVPWMQNATTTTTAPPTTTSTTPVNSGQTATGKHSRSRTTPDPRIIKPPESLVIIGELDEDEPPEMKESAVVSTGKEAVPVPPTTTTERPQQVPGRIELKLRKPSSPLRFAPVPRIRFSNRRKKDSVIGKLTKIESTLKTITKRTEKSKQPPKTKESVQYITNNTMIKPSTSSFWGGYEIKKIVRKKWKKEEDGKQRKRRGENSIYGLRRISLGVPEWHRRRRIILSPSDVNNGRNFPKRPSSWRSAILPHSPQSIGIGTREAGAERRIKVFAIDGQAKRTTEPEPDMHHRGSPAVAIPLKLKIQPNFFSHKEPSPDTEVLIPPQSSTVPPSPSPPALTPSPPSLSISPSPPSSFIQCGVAPDFTPCVPSIQASEGLLRCCRQKGLPQGCLALCRYDITQEEVKAAMDAGRCGILSVQPYLECAAAGRDNTECCRYKGIARKSGPQCEDLCRPTSGFKPLGIQHIVCGSVIRDLLQCHHSGVRE